ncbi:MAG: DUF98 domain-containing protein [Magnetococcales bacterium]|nr:DUF98 domain-containing protein [Magnetococcales bacterium]
MRFSTPWFAPEPFPDLGGSAISESFRAVLGSTDSLTRRLELLTGASGRVRLEEQATLPEWEDLPEIWPPEYRMEPSGPIMTRNAWLALGGRDLLFAHSQLLLAGMEETTRQAIRRGEQPIGSLFLARDEQMRRQRLQLALAISPALAARQGLPEDHRFFARRSLFFVADALRGRILELFWSDLTA